MAGAYHVKLFPSYYNGAALTSGRYIVYVGFAAAAVHKQRVRSKHPMYDVKELDSKRESSQI